MQLQFIRNNFSMSMVTFFHFWSSNALKYLKADDFCGNFAKYILRFAYRQCRDKITEMVFR